MKNNLKILIFVFFYFFCGLAPAQVTLKNRIDGISEPLLSGVTDQLNARIQEIQSPLTAEKISLFHQAAPGEIKKILFVQGYFHAQIKSQLTHDGNHWLGIYRINLGLPLRITRLDLSIIGDENDAELQAALQLFPLKKGAVFQTDKYNLAKQFLFSQAAQFGYLAAVLEKKAVYIDLKNNTVHVVLHFRLGSRYKFGDVNFSVTPFSQNFLTRFLPFTSGEWYASGKVKKLQESFTNSNLFEEVAVTPEFTSNQKKLLVPIAVNLKPRKARQYNFGMGFGTDTGIRGLLGMELRHVTANGQSFKGIAKLSEVQSSFEAHYLIPGFNPVIDQYDLSAALETQNQNYGKSHTLKVAAGYLTTWHNWQETLKLNFLKEEYNLTSQPIYHANLIVPSVNLLRSNTDNPIQPTQGYSINFNVQGASAAVFSTTDFLQAQVNAKYLAPLSANNQLVLRGTFGITAISNLNKLPLSFQYFAGGTQSVRGYGYKSLGPGRNLVVGSIEFRHRIFDGWYGTVFMDAGNADDTFFVNLKKGAGVGVLCNSPIGPVQLSYAKALDLPGTPSRVQFNIGPEF